MKGTKQLFVVNGGVQGTGKPLSIIFDKEHSKDEILQIISLRTDDLKGKLTFRNSFSFEEGSFGNLLLCSHTFSHNHFVTNETIDIEVKENAHADIVLMQNEHNSAEHNCIFNIKVAKGGEIKIVFLTLHGGKINNNITVSLDGENGECDLSGLYLVDGQQEVKNIITLIHNSHSCRSKQLFKGVLDDSATATFSGIIRVVQDAQKTEAYQANHHLIISNDAKAHSEPQLEIYADDVKCSHGATNGRLDESELFYMRSRGISSKEAALLQQLAFTFSVLDKISNIELKERMLNLTEQRLRGEFSDCKNCSKNCC